MYPHGTRTMKRRCRAARVLVCFFSSFLCLSPAHAQESSLEGKPVTAVRVLDEAGKPIPEKLKPLPLKPGEAFHLTAEQDSLRQLNLTGLFADIHTVATPAPDGLHIDFVVKRNYYYNVIRVAGLKEPPNEATALAALNLPLGEPFQLSALNEGLDRLGQTLRDNGFYEAKWTYGLAAHDDTRQMDITVQVTPGPRARVSAVSINNQSTFSAKQLLKKAKLKKGSVVTADGLDRSTERLRSFLVADGFLGARVVSHRGNYDSASNSIPITLDVVAGPRVRLEVTGAKISAKRMRKLVPIYQEGAVDEDLLEEGLRNVRDWLQSESYFDSTVQYTSHEDPSTHVEVIRFEINRGIKHRLVGIAFEGNKYFGTELLEGRLHIQVGGTLTRGKFSQQMVRNDGDSIHALYLTNGFLQSQVQPEVQDDYKGKKGDVYVTFHITEGQQTRVSALEIQGNHALTDKQLLSVIGSTAGQPYSDAGVTSDRDNILAYYFDQGFPDAKFEAQATAAGADRVRLVYQITEGARVDVSQVLLTGYRYTRPGIIRRQVVVKPGGPLREGDVIATQQKLYNLAIFDRVQVAPQNPSGDYPEKAVVVAVEEGQRYTISYGFGFEAQRLASNENTSVTTLSASPLGILEISKINVGGRAHTVSLKLRGSTLEYQGLLSYTAPNFLTYPWLNLIITGFADKADYVNTFTAIRYEGNLQFQQTLSPSTSLFYGYFYRHVIASNPKINQNLIPLFSQPTHASGFEITWARDRRDNPADASQGSFNTMDFSIATRSLGSTASFYRFFGQNSTFTPIGKSLVFARSIRVGIEEPFNGSTANEVPFPLTTANEIPLPELFFGGGGTSLRGFGLNQAGPRDPSTGFPIGGLTELVINQELRFPLRFPFVGNRMGGAIFYDGGNIYSRPSHVSLRWAAPKPVLDPNNASTCLYNCTNELNYFSNTIGFGLRYATPIGPVRLDLAYQLNPGYFVIPGNTPSALTRLPHFQFFFNIGSIF
jgi:outer membrane protein insertion porin family